MSISRRDRNVVDTHGLSDSASVCVSQYTLALIDLCATRAISEKELGR